MRCTMSLTTKTIVELLSERLNERDKKINLVNLHAVYDAAGLLIVSVRAYVEGYQAPVIVLNQTEMIKELVLSLNARKVGAFSDALRFQDTGSFDLRGAGQITAGEKDAVHVQFRAVIAEPVKR